ncbi:hypothetical protein SARC_01176 [Sphaeroforma arctica JP610]|uniref:Uncharacterized protein n=1 Tax=Sphaeroforma arctica JP610 TaxID=667725 RepID=A0A0L0GCH3_9EUKA|nr:hypothetical protein SARC_01176 [Sphaeroforma arctica JP610]KNC86710.1 hypothetical protein SARC_01176 [Sphaeroforma arctica JP610]|eukprot:XP_014160612.1 hypothetical protein SARC_01176 [Sphaeroforma arctica JP610]
MDSLAVTLPQFRPKLPQSYLFIDDTRIQAPQPVPLQPFLDDIDAWGHKYGLEQGVIKLWVRSTDLRPAAPTLRIKGELIIPTLADASWNTRYLPPEDITRSSHSPTKYQGSISPDMESLIAALSLGIASFRAYGFRGFSWRHPCNRLVLFKTFILSTATYGLNILVWAPPIWKDALDLLFERYNSALIQTAAIITGTKYSRFSKHKKNLLHFCGLLPTRPFADYLGGCLGIQLDSMASINPLTPLTQPAWAHNKPSLRFPYSIYAYLKTVYKTTGGHTPDHVAIRRRCDDIRKNSTKRWSNKEIAAVTRRQYYY